MPAEKIKFFREQNNLSIDYVSTQIEVSVKYYYKIENGEVDLKISKLDKLVKTIGVKKSQLFSE
jgi:transcriptional regulator with XRE-family HTH domain